MLQPDPTSAGPALGLRPTIGSLPSSKIREIAHAGMGRADLIPLWFGEPDTPTPKFICDAAATRSPPAIPSTSPMPASTNCGPRWPST